MTAEPGARCIICKENSYVYSLCPRHSRSSGIVAAYSVGSYRDELKALIYNYKFERQRAGALILARLLDAITPQLPSHTIVGAVPTAPQRIRRRGYDHAELIAKQFARQRQLPYQALLVRTSAAQQHGATKRQRAEQAKSMFKARSSLDEARVYVLIDDIVTTGATVRAAARQLHQAGASTVIVLTIANHVLEDNN